MNFQQHNHLLFFHLAAVILILTGCAPQARRPLRICPGAESAGEALSVLMIQSQNTVPLKANGKCLAQFYADGKRHKENFPIKLWLNPPTHIRLHGNVAFNARGIDLGSNESEFWLAMKPKEIGNGYFWGRWDDGAGFGELKISPEVLLGAIGIVGVGGFDPIYRIIGDIAPEGGDAVVDYLDLAEFANHWLKTSTSPNWNPECDMAPQPTPDEKVDFMDFAVLAEHWEENWSLSKEGVFDVLTKRGKAGLIIKRIYIYNCDRRIRKIEYFGDNEQIAVILELDEYRDIYKGVSVPGVIKAVSFNSDGTEDSFRITLDSIRQQDFSEKLCKALFTRPEPKGFKHIYRIIDDQVVEQRQK